MGARYMYSIGKLAKLSNITVRTLRYYDEIELLKPTKIEVGGHRYYDDVALAKLHNIMMLKEMGFDLETIHEIIGNQVKSSKELLLMRLEIIKQEQAQLEHMQNNIHEILQLMDMEGTNNWQAIFSTISKQYSRPKDFKSIWNDYFNEDEIDKLKNLPTIGVDKEIVNQWVELLRDIRKNMDKSPSSSIAQNLAKRWSDLTHEIYDGDIKLANKAWKLGKEQDLGFYEFDPEIVQFIEAAVAYSFQQKQAGEPS